MSMSRNVLLRQVIRDMEKLHRLIVLVATGQRHLTPERDQLQAAVDLKIALLCHRRPEKATEYQGTE
jgi:hypothetical protein